jgi:hypothetical protein
MMCHHFSASLKMLILESLNLDEMRMLWAERVYKILEVQVQRLALKLGTVIEYGGSS